MFIINKYYQCYYEIIQTAQRQHQTRTHLKKLKHYYERHHIIPRSLGGTNDKDNLVLLTAKEHFICHHLLIKMAANKQIRIKMIHAFWRMTNTPQQAQRITSRIYNSIKEERSRHISNSYKGNGNHFYGKKHTEQTKSKMRELARGRNPHNNYKSFSPWNKGLTKDVSESVAKIAERKLGPNNPMFGRIGIDHPNTISFALIDNEQNIIQTFHSRKSFNDYCREYLLPFNGLYATLKNDSLYKDCSKNKRFKHYNGWSLSKIII